jgi:ribosomal protein RSM22 (predicted rRNA methylase)
MSQSQNDNKKGTKVPFLISMPKISLAELEPNLLNPRLTETTHLKNIQEMSERFTSNRSQIKEYVLDEDKVASYAYLYLPTNIPKMYFLLDQLEEDVLNLIEHGHFIDYGCGPGTYAYAISSAFNHKREITCIDSSEIMLRQAKKILVNTFPQNKFNFQKKPLGKIENGILFFGNSINEIGIQKTLDIINLIDPKIVMFIEPGTSELFVEIKKLRHELINFFDIVYPCPTNSACENSWCHQVLRISHELDVERFSQLVSLDRKTLPLNAHVYIKKEIKAHITKNELTIVRYLNETKFSFIYEACVNVNGENKIKKIEILKKKMSKIQEKEFKNLNVGVRIKFMLEKELDDLWRGFVD